MHHHNVGFVLLPILNSEIGIDAIKSVLYKRQRQPGGWKAWLEATRGDCESTVEGAGELLLRDEAAVELLQAVGRVVHDHKMTVNTQLLLPTSQQAAGAAEGVTAPAAAAAAAADGTATASSPDCADAAVACVPALSTLQAAGSRSGSACIVSADNSSQHNASLKLPCLLVKLMLGVPVSFLEHGSWKRSPAAALLFKQLFPCNTDLGEAVQQAMLPRLGTQQQQQQQQQQPDPASSSTGRYTLLSCFRELPSVNTAPPPMAISIQQQQDQDHILQQQQPIQQLQPTAQTAAAAAAEGAGTSNSLPSGSNSRSSSSSQGGPSTSLADIPAEVMQRLLSLLSARDLAALALTCRGLRGATWEAVPALKLTLYPHQRNALSWMLHREVHGGQAVPHPFIRPYVTHDSLGDEGLPVFLNQVTGELGLDAPEPVTDIRGGFFCDEPGLGKTVTALSLILKTQGTVPAAPDGASVTWLHGPDGRRLGFYTSTDAAATAEDDAAQAADSAAAGPSRRHSSSSMRRSSSSFTSMGVLSLASGRRGSSARSQQRRAWQLAPSLRGGSSTRRARSGSARAESPAAAAAAGGVGDAGAPVPVSGALGGSRSGSPAAGAGGLGDAAAVGSRGAGEAPAGLSGQVRVGSTDHEGAGEQPAGPKSPQQQSPQPQQPLRVTRQSVSGSAAACVAAADQAAAVAACDGSPPEQSAAKRRKTCNGTVLQQQQKEQPAQQEHQADAAWSAAGAPAERVVLGEAGCGGVGADGAGCVSEQQSGGWVMCDHCSKWRSLPAGHQLSAADPDLPWYCCLHPDPDLASCLAPEEPHDGNTKATADPSIANLRYSACAGFIAADAAAAAGCGEPDPDNVAHFSAVINAAATGPGAEGSLDVLCWLAKQQPAALLMGVTVPRGLREAAPDYGRLFRMTSLQLSSEVRASTPAPPPKSGTQGKKQPASKAKTKGAKKRKRRSSSSDDDDDDDYSGSDGDFRADLDGRGSMRQSPAPAAQAGPAQQAAGRSSSAAGGGKARRQRLSAAATAAAVHTWQQPDSLAALLFDVAALRAALVKGEAAAPRMFLSSATLVIVPVTLIPHWQQQIRQHLMPRRLRVLVLGSATAVAGGQDGVGLSGSRSSKALKTSSTAAGGGGAAESVCPPAHELAWGYDVVITTFQRLSNDWSMRSDPRLAERLVLLKVHWLRIIVDEGHSLGASLGITNKLSMAVKLTAQRRWVMTGTPTPSTASGSGAAYLQPLLAFLHQQPFGAIKAAWDGAVAKPLEAAAEAGSGSSNGSTSAAAGGASSGVVVAEWGRAQLLQLLSRVMIRSCKADLALLPPCYKKVTLLDFAPDHANSYNKLVEVIRRNLLLADWCDDAHYESLLNSKQARWAKEMLTNTRLACCVAGGMTLVPKEDDLLETLQLLSGRLGYAQPSKEQHAVLVNIEHPQPDVEQPGVRSSTESAAVLAAADGAGAAAAAAGADVPDQGTDRAVPPQDGAVTPGGTAAGQQVGAAGQEAGAVGAAGIVLRQRWYFTGPGHPLHTIEEGLREGCVCQVCGSWSTFPLVTPCGHMQCTDCTALSRTSCRVCDAAYRMQRTDDPERYKTNPQPKWEVPLDLIEWQPVYHQEGATGVSGGEWSADWQHTNSTKVLLLLQRLIEIGVHTPRSQHQAGPLITPAGAVSSGPQHCWQQGSARAGSPVVKAIVFSQFWIHVLLIAEQLKAHGVRHMVLKRDMAAREKQEAVMDFRAYPHSCCLLMDESGALGLDLSFVRYIFLMEPIADASLEQQVVSRAHRMGAVAPVHVEVLAMKHTAEEHMVALRHQAASGKLSASAADAAASSFAAAVAQAADAAGDGASSPAAAPEAADRREAADQQQQQQPDVEELGGATATANAVDISNITDFVAVGAGENQLNSRALRNLLLLHLKKVNVAELPELPAYEGAATLLDAHGGVAAVAGQPPGSGVALGSPAAAGSSAPQDLGSPGGSRQALWGDVALQRPYSASGAGSAQKRKLEQQQQQPPEPADLAREDGTCVSRSSSANDAQPQLCRSQEQSQQQVPNAGAGRRVMFADVPGDQQAQQPAVQPGRDGGAPQHRQKCLRFADGA